jgi:hypothetical protein
VRKTIEEILAPARPLMQKNKLDDQADQTTLLVALLGCVESALTDLRRIADALEGRSDAPVFTRDEPSTD